LNAVKNRPTKEPPMPNDPQTHSSPQLIPSTDDHEVIPAEASLDALATPTTVGRRRPTQHEDRRDDYNEDEGY